MLVAVGHIRKVGGLCPVGDLIEAAWCKGEDVVIPVGNARQLLIMQTSFYKNRQGYDRLLRNSRMATECSVVR